ncbi:hypothetical protein ABH940_006387 [Streptacidiphilus sp. BW17]
MDPILDDASALLPLTVTTVAPDQDGVLVGGSNWHYRINTEWHIGGQSSGIQELASLIGRRVTDLALETHGEYRDLRLTFDDSRSLTAVSDFPYGEWIFSITAPGDPQGLPVFDLSGPC